ncbi:MAG: hypothetical protein QOG76_3426, partial [Pseudonocardiales bacterium]|nr:hypothetical protein [Pseudonocardiales bacterium]
MGLPGTLAEVRRGAEQGDDVLSDLSALRLTAGS